MECFPFFFIKTKMSKRKVTRNMNIDGANYKCDRHFKISILNDRRWYLRNAIIMMTILSTMIKTVIMLMMITMAMLMTSIRQQLKLVF